jgi:endogenous inhibitor of DNA gyrase (YacG/DUF329 family)
VSAPRQVACPTCERVATAHDPKVAPFCSARCQEIDLGRWLAEDYRIPDPVTDASGGGVEGLPAPGEAPAGRRS